jgi:hypothetical protein
MQLETYIPVSEKTRIAYFPRELVNSGFKGRVPYLKSAMAVVLLHPYATLDEVEESLQVILQEIKVRKNHVVKTGKIWYPKSQGEGD